jgi:hypothetical protein
VQPVSSEAFLSLIRGVLPMAEITSGTNFIDGFRCEPGERRRRWLID